MLKPTVVLTERQLLFLHLFSKSSLAQSFYLSGGTALCGFYIPYRLSDDLDFFSPDEFNIRDVIVWLKSVKGMLGYKTFDVQTSFNRNLIFLVFDDYTLKTEFTYYPFPSKKVENYQNVRIDSLEDIALNKLFTMYQHPRIRDFMDFYMIIHQESFDFNQLRFNAKAKFDWDIDPIQLGSQLLKVTDHKDVPKLTGPFDFKDMEKYFLNIAASLKSDILK